MSNFEVNKEKETQNVAIDLGFGFVKAKCGDNYFIQPSIIGEPRQLLEEQLRLTDVIYDSSYFVGDLAIRQSKARHYSMEENKANSKVTEILMCAAIGAIADPNKKINLITGLPFSFHASQKPQMVKLIDKIQNKTVSTYVVANGNSTVNIDIVAFKIVPQGFASIMNELLDSNGQLINSENLNKRILNINIGFYSTEFVILEGMEIHQKSHSRYDLGVSALYENMLEHLDGKRPQLHLFDKCVRNREFEGMNINSLVEKSFEILADQIDAEVKALNIHIDKITMSGGIAREVQKYSNIKGITVSQDSQLDDLHGYEKMAKYQWG